jgi:hypothetical protein
MIRFLLGAIAGGVAVWLWGERMRDMAESTTYDARAKVADTLGSVQETTEEAIDGAKDRIRTGLQAGQDYIRPAGERAH